MIKEIKYNGYTVTPSDYECEDGDLDMASNLVQEDGALQPILPPLEEFGIGANYRLVFIHKVKPEYQYILYDTENNRLYRTTKAAAVAGTSGYPVQISTEMYPSFNHVDAVGNTLLVFSDTYTSSGTTYAGGIDYYLWKGTAYNHLGDHIPDIQLSFGLKGKPKLYSCSNNRSSTFTITFNTIARGKIYDEFSDENKTKITEQIMAKVNPFIKEQTIDKGCFCFPFLLRYALRLYDGTLVGHSAPILMNPSTKNAPLVLWNRAYGDDGYSNAICDIMLVSASLDYKTMTVGDYTSAALNNWKDIVKSVDVFISKPIYPYDQNGKITHLGDTDNFETKFIGKLCYNGTVLANNASPQEDAVIGALDNTDFFDNYSEWSYDKIFGLYFRGDRQYPNTSFHMPEFSEGKVGETVRNTSSFYKLCSLNLDDIVTSASASTRTDITVDNDYLDSLLQRETMTDDYLSHDKLIAGVSQGYNNRLNLTGVSRVLYSGFAVESMEAYADHLMTWTKAADNTLTIAPYSGSATTYHVDVYIKENEQDYKVSIDGTTSLVALSMLQYQSLFNYFYYPNANAYKMVLRDRFAEYDYIDLKPHDFLNGAFAFIEYDKARTADTWTAPTVSTSNIVDMPQKIYTSEVNNPFFFPVTGINTVGTGKVIGISTAAKALSEGQFGQFPLYAFSTEGVWAMEVSDTGTYKTRQPITRDVCINEESITQLDNAVLFATDRGIMILSGSTSTCISDEINDETPFNVSMLPQMGALLTGLGYEVASIATTFRTFLMGCRMIYDYVHQRVVVYNPEYDYSYVFSMKSKHWTTMPSKIIDSIPSYPQAYAVSQGEEDENNMLVDLSQDTTDEDALKGIKGVVITRPLKLDYPDALKTINTIIQRGYFDYHNDGTVKKVQQVLYGSRDLFNWYPVFSSQDLYLRGFRGTPYKYFRLALICNLDKDETLVGCTVQYEPRLTNKPR